MLIYMYQIFSEVIFIFLCIFSSLLWSTFFVDTLYCCHFGLFDTLFVLCHDFTFHWIYSGLVHFWGGNRMNIFMQMKSSLEEMRIATKRFFDQDLLSKCPSHHWQYIGPKGMVFFFKF